MQVIKADRAKCQGYANCVMAAPEYFDLDDDGKVVVLSERFAEGDRVKVESAVRSCPTGALSLHEE